jgi:hypothetical protein
MPWYGQLGAFATLSLLGAGVFWNWYAKPLHDTIDQRQAQWRTILRADIDRGSVRPRGACPSSAGRSAALEAQLDRLRPVLPDGKGRGRICSRRIQGMATQSDLTIRGSSRRRRWRPSRCTPNGRSGSSSMARTTTLAAFLERVSKFPRIINVTSIHIRARDSATSGNTITDRLHGDDVRADRAEETRGSHRGRRGRNSDANRTAPPAVCDCARVCIREPVRGALLLRLRRPRPRAAPPPHLGTQGGLLSPSVDVERRLPATPCCTGGGRSASGARDCQHPLLPQPPGPELEPQGYTYRTEGRRDPFTSLLLRGSPDSKTDGRLRARGGSFGNSRPAR